MIDLYESLVEAMSYAKRNLNAGCWKEKVFFSEHKRFLPARKKTFKKSTDRPSIITNLVASSDLEYVHFSDALDIVNLLAGAKFDPKREVNSFLGWAIKEVFIQYCSHADNTETGGNEDTIKNRLISSSQCGCFMSKLSVIIINT
jgi:hypothetical protein